MPVKPGNNHPRIGLMCSCGQLYEAHPRCKRCGISFGPGHIEGAVDERGWCGNLSGNFGKIGMGGNFWVSAKGTLFEEEELTWTTKTGGDEPELPEAT